MHKSIGELQYFDHPLKVIVEVDPTIGIFYRSLIPKWCNAQPQRYPFHISVVRNEIPKNMTNWKRYSGSYIQFEYEDIIRQGRVYFWLNIYSTALERIRQELGLSISSEFTRPPDGFVKCFHTTLANCKL